MWVRQLPVAAGVLCSLRRRQVESAAPRKSGSLFKLRSSLCWAARSVVMQHYCKKSLPAGVGRNKAVCGWPRRHRLQGGPAQASSQAPLPPDWQRAWRLDLRAAECHVPTVLASAGPFACEVWSLGHLPDDPGSRAGGAVCGVGLAKFI